MIYSVIYLLAVIVANLTVSFFGPQSAVIVAFLLIGLDLTLRDRLHDAWNGRYLWPKMLALIAAGSLLSWLVNRSAQQVAVASLVAFAVAGTADAVVYHLLGGRKRWLRVNGSNLAGAALDSLIFPWLAFGAFLWPIVLGQFLAKTVGGLLWSVVIPYMGGKNRAD